MKIASFVDRSGAGYGIVDGDRILRLDTLAGAPADLRSYLGARFPNLAPRGGNCEILRLADVTLLPPVPNPGKIFSVATNFYEEGKTAPQFPLLFMRHGEAQTAHEGALLKPAVSEQLDFEGELAVIIGRRAHKIAPAEALTYVAGYSCFNEGSVRDWQKHSTQFTPGKNFYHSGAFGPWMVCTQDIPDPARLSLESRVNGVVRQSIALDRMIFDVPWLISYISTFAPLDPGDVIVTGTPTGFGASRNPPQFLSPGDVVEIAISGIGTLRNTVIADSDSPFIS